jgi:hypothetical protein
MFYDWSEPLNMDQIETFFQARSFLLLLQIRQAIPSHHSTPTGAAGAIGAVLTPVAAAVRLLAYKA